MIFDEFLTLLCIFSWHWIIRKIVKIRPRKEDFQLQWPNHGARPPPSKAVATSVAMPQPSI